MVVMGFRVRAWFSVSIQIEGWLLTEIFPLHIHVYIYFLLSTPLSTKIIFGNHA